MILATCASRGVFPLISLTSLLITYRVGTLKAGRGNLHVVFLNSAFSLDIPSSLSNYQGMFFIISSKS